MPKTKFWLPSGVKRYLDTANTQIRRREEQIQKLANLIPKGSFYWYLPRNGAFKAKLNQQTTIGSVPAREKHAVEMLSSFLWMDGNSTTSWILQFPPPTYLRMAQLGSITIQMAFTAFCIIQSPLFWVFYLNYTVFCQTT